MPTGGASRFRVEYLPAAGSDADCWTCPLAGRQQIASLVGAGGWGQMAFGGAGTSEGSAPFGRHGPSGRARDFDVRVKSVGAGK